MVACHQVEQTCTDVGGQHAAMATVRVCNTPAGRADTWSWSWFCSSGAGGAGPNFWMAFFSCSAATGGSGVLLLEWVLGWGARATRRGGRRGCAAQLCLLLAGPAAGRCVGLTCSPGHDPREGGQRTGARTVQAARRSARRALGRADAHSRLNQPVRTRTCFFIFFRSFLDAAGGGGAAPPAGSAGFGFFFEPMMVCRQV